MTNLERSVQVLMLALLMYSSIRWPPIAVLAMPIGTSTPSSDSCWAKYLPR